MMCVSRIQEDATPPHLDLNQPELGNDWPPKGATMGICDHLGIAKFAVPRPQQMEPSFGWMARPPVSALLQL